MSMITRRICMMKAEVSSLNNVKPYKTVQKDVNTDVLIKCNITRDAEDLRKYLKSLKQKYIDVFSGVKKQELIELGIKQKKAVHGKRKAIKRKLSRCKNSMRTLLPKIIPGYIPQV